MWEGENLFHQMKSLVFRETEDPAKKRGPVNQKSSFTSHISVESTDMPCEAPQGVILNE